MAKTLKDVAAMLRAEGWVRNIFWKSGAGYCVEGALRAVTGYYEELPEDLGNLGASNEDYWKKKDRQCEERAALRNELDKRIKSKYPEAKGVFDWNDDIVTNLDEVLELLEAEV